ncbi:MAG: hypothetical protein ACLUVC_11965 [Longibaculum sp.]
MKKSTILSFATAAAIVATSLGTYAAWDKLNDTKTVALTTAKAHTVTLPSENLIFDGTLSDTTKEITAPLTVTTEEAKELKLEATNIKLGGEDATGKVAVTFLDNDGTTAITNPISDPAASKEYKVKVALVDTDVADKPAEYANKPVTFDINATITAND